MVKGRGVLLGDTMTSFADRTGMRVGDYVRQGSVHYKSRVVFVFLYVV